jgi:hypothetical protein
MAGEEASAGAVDHHRADVAISVVQRLRLVGLAVRSADLAISAAHDDRAFGRPGNAGHCRGLYELVTDHFLLSKVIANLVDKDDVVSLGNRQPVGFGTEGQALKTVMYEDNCLYS